MKDNYDKLDDFFRKSMQDNSPDESWNIPSETLFDQAIKQVNNVEAPWFNRKAFYLFPILLLLSSLAYLLITNLHFTNNERSTTEYILKDINLLKSENALLKTEIANLHETNKKLSNRIDLLVNKHVELTSTSIEKMSKSITASTSKTKKRVTSYNTDNSDSYSLPSKTAHLNYKHLDNSAGTIHTPIEAASMSSHSLILEQVKVNNNSVNNELPHLPMIQNIPLFKLKRPIQFLNQSVGIKVVKTNEVPIHYFGVSVGFNNSWLSMNKIPQGDMEKVTDYGKAHSCYGAKIDMGYQLNNRWNLVADLSYNRFVNRSNASYNFFYDEDNVYTDQNNIDMYKADLPMMNPYGNYDAGVSFRVNSSMQQNELVKEKTQTRQTLNALILSLGADYSLYKTNKLNIILGAGFGIGTKLNLKNEFDISIYMDDQLKHHSVDNTNDLKGVNTTFLNTHVNVGVDYMLNDYFSVGVESHGLKSLTSLRDSWPNEGPKTFLNAINTTVGLKYHW